jgi:hypothetical protein
MLMQLRNCENHLAELHKHALHEAASEPADLGSVLQRVTL